MKRRIQCIVLALLGLVIVVGLWLVWKWQDRPSLLPYQSLVLPQAGDPPGALRVVFLGCLRCC